MSGSVPFETTLHVRDHCLCFAAQRAARALARRFDDAFRPLGLTNGQFSLLMSLNRPAAPAMGAIAEFLGMDRTTLTANLKPLERRGLVQIKPDDKDRRGRRLALTEQGHAVLLQAVPIWQRTLAEVEQTLGPSDVGPLRTGLNTLGR